LAPTGPAIHLVVEIPPGALAGSTCLAGFFYLHRLSSLADRAVRKGRHHMERVSPCALAKGTFNLK